MARGGFPGMGGMNMKDMMKDPKMREMMIKQQQQQLPDEE